MRRKMCEILHMHFLKCLRFFKHPAGKERLVVHFDPTYSRGSHPNMFTNLGYVSKE